MTFGLPEPWLLFLSLRSDHQMMFPPYSLTVPQTLGMTTPYWLEVARSGPGSWGRCLATSTALPMSVPMLKP